MKPAVLAVALLLLLAAPAAHGFVLAAAKAGLVVVGLTTGTINICRTAGGCFWLGGVWSGSLTVKGSEGEADEVSCVTWLLKGSASLQIPTSCDKSEAPLLPEISTEGLDFLNWDIGEKACTTRDDGVKEVVATATVRDNTKIAEEPWSCVLMKRTGDDKATLTFGPFKENEDEALLACPTKHGAEDDVAAGFMELSLERDGTDLDEVLEGLGVVCT